MAIIYKTDEIRIDDNGDMYLLDDGKMKRIYIARPEKGDKGETKGFGYPWFWDVVFSDGSYKLVSGLKMRALLGTRTMICSERVLKAWKGKLDKGVQLTTASSGEREG